MERSGIPVRKSKVWEQASTKVIRIVTNVLVSRRVKSCSVLMLAPQPVVHRYAGLKLKSAGGIFLSCNELAANLCVFLRLSSWKRTTIRRGAGTIFQILRRSSTGSSAKSSNVTSGALLSSVGASKVLECSERQEISGFWNGLRMRILKRHNGTLSQRMVRDIT